MACCQGCLTRMNKWFLLSKCGMLFKVPFVLFVLLLWLIQTILLALLWRIPKAIMRCCKEPAPTEGKYHVRPGVIRTPLERFAGIDYHEQYPPQYFEYKGYRVAYVDTGASGAVSADGADGAGGVTILMLHGMPDWGYLYKDLVKAFTAEGHRCVVPDFLGCGRSDKMTNFLDYTTDLNEGTIIALAEHLDLTNVVLIVQDWGGMHGLALLPEIEARVCAVVIANTGLKPMVTKSSVVFWNFLFWRTISTMLGHSMPVGSVMNAFTVPAMNMTEEEVRAYDAPYPTRRAKAGLVAWPKFVPFDYPCPFKWLSDLIYDHSRMPHKHFAESLQFLLKWERPLMLAFSDSDAVFHGDEGFYVDNIKALAGVKDALAEQGISPMDVPQPVVAGNGRIVTIANAGHFLQHDQGPQLARRVIEFMNEQVLAGAKQEP